MVRPAALLLCSAIVVAQAPQENPFDAAGQAYWQARQKGQYAVATTQREAMNGLLATQAASDPLFAGRARVATAGPRFVLGARSESAESRRVHGAGSHCRRANAAEGGPQSCAYFR